MRSADPKRSHVATGDLAAKTDKNLERHTNLHPWTRWTDAVDHKIELAGTLESSRSESLNATLSSRGLLDKSHLRYYQSVKTRICANLISESRIASQFVPLN
jgi:hypothetical protein